MLLTIFTPTYNRAYCLPALYNSLQRQTNKNFIWLLIDDGSTDNTKDIVQGFTDSATFPITYVRQQNSGKHVAYNKAVELCSTELFFCVDSDDYLTDDAVESITKKYAKDVDKRILGYYYKRLTPDGEMMSSQFPENISQVGITDLYHNYNFRGDTAIILKTSLIKNIYFPVFPREKFVSERVVYNQYNSIAPMVVVDRGIYVSEYLPDGYTKNGVLLRIKNPYGTALDYLSESYYSTKLMDKAKYYAQYLAFCKVFELDKNIFTKFNKPPFSIRSIGQLFVGHYVKIFSGQKATVFKDAQLLTK